jgi:Raf kinase inhibitor-like YbhB/YbcL family protein
MGSSKTVGHTVLRTRCTIPSISFVMGLGGFLALTFAMQVGCSSAASQRITPSLELASASFSGDTIPKSCSSCNSQDGASPELSWKAPPGGTQSFALIVTDKDSPLGFNFVHWVFYDIPPDKRELPEGIAKLEQLPDGSRQGHNDYDRIGYVGPCPPGHSIHRYIFNLYALDAKLNLQPGVSKKQVVKAMKGHVLALGELVGRFQQ